MWWDGDGGKYGSHSFNARSEIWIAFSCGRAMLSGDRRCIIFNMPGDGYRDLLVMAMSEPGEDQFSHAWKLRDGPADELGVGPEWSYPNAVEHDGVLYVVYTTRKNGCVMTTCPDPSHP